MIRGFAFLISEFEAVDAGEPGSVWLLVRIDVVHAVGVPAFAGWLQNWARAVFHFDVGRGREFENVESSDARAVLRHAVLRETDQFVVQRQ